MSEISFALEQGSLIADDRWDARFLRALLLSFLIEPTLPKRSVPHVASNGTPGNSKRARVLEVFNTEVAIRFGRSHQATAKKATDTYRRLERLAQGDENRVERLLKSQPPNSYLREWGSKKVTRDTGLLRDIFSVGLYVLVLDDLSKDNAVIKKADGKQALQDQYQTGHFWVTNADRFPKALKRFRPVAHLAAALVRLLDEHNCLTRDRKAFTTWRRHMPRFLLLAKYYEEFLTVKKVTGRRTFDRHKARYRASTPAALYKLEEVWCLPPIDGVSQVQRMPRLPVQDRKAAAGKNRKRGPSARA